MYYYEIKAVGKWRSIKSASKPHIRREERPFHRKVKELTPEEEIMSLEELREKFHDSETISSS